MTVEIRLSYVGRLGGKGGSENTEYSLVGYLSNNQLLANQEK